MNPRKSLYDIDQFYKKKAVLTASYNGMRYRISRHEQTDPQEETTSLSLAVSTWPEPYGFEATDDANITTKHFSFDEEGLDAAYEWLCDQYNQHEDQWSYAKEHPMQGTLY